MILLFVYDRSLSIYQGCYGIAIIADLLRKSKGCCINSPLELGIYTIDALQWIRL